MSQLDELLGTEEDTLWARFHEIKINFEGFYRGFRFKGDILLQI